MVFETLNIRGFGCLRTSVDFAPDKLNLAVADNEAGKSTLIAAMLAAFYGIVEDERYTSDKRPRKKNVLPWVNPDEFGLVLDFSMNNLRWRIERDFNSSLVKLINRDTGKDHTDEYHKGRGTYSIGEELIGLTCSDFLKSFYLRQEEILEIRDAGGLTPHVQRAATAREGGATSENAIQRLEQALKDYPLPPSKGLRIENALKRLESERDGKLDELDRLNRSRADIEPQCRRLSDLERELKDLREEREKCEKLGDFAEMRELKRLIEIQEKLAEEHAELERDAEDLKTFDQFPANKWEQLNKLSTRIEDLESNIVKLDTKLKDEVETNLTRLEGELQNNSSLAGITENELRDFEATVSRLTDRRERMESALQHRDDLEKKLSAEGIDKEEHKRLAGIFARMTDEEKQFVEEFRATFAERESAYRETKQRREWLERDRAAILDRRQRILSNSRAFFIMAAVMFIAGGMLIVLTQGEWLGQVLAGLGGVLGATGAFIRGSAGRADTTSLKRLDEVLTEALELEDEEQSKLDEVGRNMNDLASRLRFEDGNAMMTEYFNFDRLGDKIEPLLEAERALERTREEENEIIEQAKPFFTRAGENYPGIEDALQSALNLLNRYREVVKTSEEYKAVKARKTDFEEDLKRFEKDLESNRQLCSEILELGGIDKELPLKEALEGFRKSLDNHRRYRAVVDEHLPRVQRDILPEVDLNAKSDRMKQLQDKSADWEPPETIDHSKEYYRDQADRIFGNLERLGEERLTINRNIGNVYDNYQSHNHTIQQRLSEIEDEINRAETFRSEVETALSIMREISREVYRSWASALSEESLPFVRALNPRYDELKFDENLAFTIMDVKYNRTITSSEIDSVLSTGARDEVFLAARLGISSYLARGAKGPIPIILDEPLSAVDDDKFLSGMQFFLEMLSTKHQVLIMSCHEERHRWLREQIPELYESRVQEISLVTGVPEKGKEPDSEQVSD